MSKKVNPDGSLDEPLYQRAVSTAKREYMNDLCQVALHGTSGKDLAFLHAMTADGGSSSKIMRITERLGVSQSYALTYKKRLIESGFIEQVTRGEVRFAVPMLKEYLTALQAGFHRRM